MSKLKTHYRCETGFICHYAKQYTGLKITRDKGGVSCLICKRRLYAPLLDEMEKSNEG